MRALFVMDPLSTIHVDQDSSYVLMLEWAARGFEVWHCGPQDLWARMGQVFAEASRLKVGPKPHVADVLERATLATASCAAIFKRTDPPFDMGYIFCTYLLDCAGPDTVVCNSPGGIRDANEKMVILRFPELIPDTLVTRDQGHIRAFLADRGGRGIIKPWDGNGGRGIFVLTDGDPNLGVILETSTDDGRKTVMVQEYVPEIVHGDKRILLVDGDPKGAFLRIPTKKDHRGNMHVGASVKGCEMTERDRHICEAIKPYLIERDLLFAGIDVIGDKLTEVNVTSPTGIQECTRLYGSHIEADIVDAVLARRSTP